MGTKVQFESCFPGYFSMRDLNEDSNSCSWPLYYGDRTFTNGQYYNGFLPRTIADVYSGYDKDVVKRTMLEHEAIFKNQLCELHRLYRIQRDLMDEAKRKELNKNRMPVETSLSSSPLASQITSEDARKWHIPGFPLGNSVCAGPSTSGIEDMHSPLSSMKGSSVQASPLLSQNAGTSKDAEVLESRPTKVRRKMFDLHLPADEYMDTEVGEQLMDGNLSSISSYMPNRNSNHIVASGKDLLIGGGGKNNCQGGALRVESCLKSKNNLADLNEPVEVEDTNTSSNDHLGCTSAHYEIEELELAAKTKSDFLGFPQQVLVNSHKGRSNGAINDPYLSNDDNRKSWFRHMPDSGHSKNNLTSATQDLQLEKMFSSSQAIPVLSNINNESVTLFLNNQSKADQSRERIVHGSQLAKVKKESSATSHPISVLTSNVPSQYGVDPCSDLSKSWSHSISSWEKLNGSLNQNSMSVQVHPSLNSSVTLSRSSQSSTQSHGIFGDRWHHNTNSANLITQSNVPDKNGFYHGSSSGSQELQIRFPSSNYDYLNCSGAGNAASEHFVNQNSTKLYKSLNCMELKPGKEVNLNIAHSSSSSTKIASQKCLEVIDLERNHDDNVVALPWLRATPNCKNDSTYVGVDLNAGGFVDRQSYLNVLSDTSEAGKVSNQLVHQNKKPASFADGVEESRIGTSDSSCCKKILGFPIFEKSHISKIEPSSLTSPSAFHPQPLEVVENNRKNRFLDINLPCDQAIADSGPQTAAEMDTQVARVRHRIDLNFCATEDEACLMTSVTGSNVKVILGFDLEAPAVPEDEEDIVQVQECLEKADAAAVSLQSTQKNIDSEPDECIRIAAEAIVAISSSVKDNHQDNAATHHPSEASMTDPLHWFVDIVSSFGEDLENKYAALGAENCQNNDWSSSEDYFELMTLRLKETKEEDYTPMPLVPENLVLEEAGKTLLTTRARRGHGRRGRQRRDFQRDILPGLTSLSRHEVTEDLQTFGGMMKATGQLWHAGLTRRNSTRNGCGRGRRRSLTNASPAATENPPPPPPPPPPPLVQQLNNVEAGLEDRNLTGWGKTTRRPRRQRCPPGNPPPSLPLT
ncbi:hypothetical protein M5689_004262 [Euphorbia peplus]|nr:hypothetical protein M5689_004262 [Euphorbia peplus]